MAKKIVILGGGESGVGAALLATKKGLEVFLSDKGEIKKENKEVLSNNRIKWEEGQHSEGEIFLADEIVKSPGIPDNVPLLNKARQQGIPVISEIEFAARYTNGKLICVTGSNGKTTTTLLTSHILNNSNLDVATAGNVGKSFAGQLAESDHEYWVLELSSFQLDGMYDFKADIAILLNVTPDHLDRYDYEFQNYVNSKFRITQNMDENDVFIYWADDPVIQKELQKRDIKAKKFPFSENRENSNETTGAYVENEQLIINNNNNTFTMRIHELALQGRHNLNNSMASGMAARTLELRKETIRESLANFTNVEHRLEYVAHVAGIKFINDSKATNINSCWYALESMEEDVIWIAGGVDKGNDYAELFDLVKDRVKVLICLGKDNSKLKEAFTGKIDEIVEAKNMFQAVKLGYQYGHKGDTVLLSPACASFDLFEDYEERGRMFKSAVKSL